MSSHVLVEKPRAARFASLLALVLLLVGCGSLNKLFSPGDSKDAADAAVALFDALPGYVPVGVDSALAADALMAAGIDSAVAATSVDPPQPSVAVEAPAIVAVVSALTAAITAQKLDTAAAQFAPEVRDRYSAMFASATPEKLTALATALAQVNVTTVVLGSVHRADQRAEGTVTHAGRVFHVGFVKHANTWLIESL